MQEGAKGLQGLYNTDTSGMLNAMGQESRDIDAETEAQKAGPAWMQNVSGMLGIGLNAAKLAGGFGVPGFGGFKPQQGAGGSGGNSY